VTDPIAVNAAERISGWMAAQLLELPPALVETTAWTLASAGRDGPPPAHPANVTCAAIAAAVASGDEGAFERAVMGAAERGREALYQALLQAEVLGGGRWPHQVAGQIARFGEPLPARTVVHALATTDPGAALRLVDGLGDLRLSPEAVEALAELVVTARDAGAPDGRAEERWSALERDRPVADAESAWLDMGLRLAAHADLDEAVDELEDVVGWYGWEDFIEGPLAVLGRLVRVDAERAVELAATGGTAAVRADLLQTLTWWGEIPAPAVQLLESLIKELAGEDDTVVASAMYSLARMGDRARLRDVLERRHPADDTIIAGVAPAVRRRRHSGSDDWPAVLELALGALSGGEPRHGPDPADRLTVQARLDPDGPWWRPYGPGLP
jgi:hypothetical protein